MNKWYIYTVQFSICIMKKYKYEVFTAGIQHRIQKGILKPGDKLPSVRTVKNEFGLSTSSVQSGYEYLIHKGYVASIPRSGYIVALQKSPRRFELPADFPPVTHDPVFRQHLQHTSERESHSGFSAFHSAVPSDAFIPQKLILRTMQQVIREKGTALLRYYPPNGSPELQGALARRAAAYGCFIRPEEIVVTDGALQALYIALAAVTIPGDLIAVESPCVFSILEVCSSLRLKTIEIPVRYEDGLDVAYLKNICGIHRIKALVLTPNFHNPTGILLSDEKKRAIVAVAASQQLPIIENDVYGDLYFTGTRPSTLRNFDTAGWVITFSSFSKTLAPGIRLGWLAAGRFFAEVERVRFSLGRSVAPLNQEILIKLLHSSAYDKHLRQFRRNLERQALQLVHAFNTHFPKGSYAHPPQGGYSIWAHLPFETDMKMFDAACERFRIRFTPGASFSCTDAYHHCFRMIFSQRLTPAGIEALQKVGTLLCR